MAWLHCELPNCSLSIPSQPTPITSSWLPASLLHILLQCGITARLVSLRLWMHFSYSPAAEHYSVLLWILPGRYRGVPSLPVLSFVQPLEYGHWGVYGPLFFLLNWSVACKQERHTPQTRDEVGHNTLRYQDSDQKAESCQHLRKDGRKRRWKRSHCLDPIFWDFDS